MSSPKAFGKLSQVCIVVISQDGQDSRRFNAGNTTNFYYHERVPHKILMYMNACIKTACKLQQSDSKSKSNSLFIASPLVLAF